MILQIRVSKNWFPQKQKFPFILQPGESQFNKPSSLIGVSHIGSHSRHLITSLPLHRPSSPLSPSFLSNTPGIPPPAPAPPPSPIPAICTITILSNSPSPISPTHETHQTSVSARGRPRAADQGFVPAPLLVGSGEEVINVNEIPQVGIDLM